MLIQAGPLLEKINSPEDLKLNQDQLTTFVMNCDNILLTTFPFTVDTLVLL